MQALVLLGDFNRAYICWKSGVFKITSLCSWESPNQGEALLDLLLTNAKKNSEVKMEDSLGCSDHALVEFFISKGIGWVKIRNKSLNRKRGTELSAAWGSSAFSHFPWENESWVTVKVIFLRAQIFLVLIFKKVGRDQTEGENQIGEACNSDTLTGNT